MSLVLKKETIKGTIVRPGVLGEDGLLDILEVLLERGRKVGVPHESFDGLEEREGVDGAKVENVRELEVEARVGGEDNLRAAGK